MLLNNPELAHQMAKERMRDSLRAMEQERLIEIAQDASQRRAWRLPVGLILSRLLAPFRRLPSRQIPQGG